MQLHLRVKTEADLFLSYCVHCTRLNELGESKGEKTDTKERQSMGTKIETPKADEGIRESFRITSNSSS